MGYRTNSFQTMIIIKLIAATGGVLLCLGFIMGLLNIFIIDKDDNRPLKLLAGGGILIAFAGLCRLFYFILESIFG